MNKITNNFVNNSTKFALTAFLIMLILVPWSNGIAGEVTSAGGINWGKMMMGLFGGLALFLYGLEKMSDALKTALGDQMKTLLAKLTRNRFTGAMTGAFVTAIIQSSSITTVLVVGFVSAGMMTLPQSIGVIFGANVGTTFTAQIVAFKVEEAALWMIAIGFLAMFIANQERIKHYGNMLMGLGLIFFGMALMGDAMHPLRSYEPFLDLMIQMSNPFMGILIGALFTGLVQSSSATTAIVITMASQGFITLEAGIALTFGANIGTCITAMLAALGKPRVALRVAMIHLMFSIGGVAIWLPFINILAGWATELSPSYSDLQGTARLAAEVPRQVANAYTVFNLTNLVIFIGFTTYFARIVTWLVPIKEEVEKVIIRPKYLDKSLIDTPSLALQNVRFEIARMGGIVQEMLSEFREAMLNRDREKLDKIQKMDDRVDILDSEILQYLASLRTETLSEQESKDTSIAMKLADGFENIGDVIESDLVELGAHVLDQDIKSSDAMRYIYKELTDKLIAALAATIRAVKELDQNAAEEVLTMKSEINRLLNQALELQTQSLTGLSSEKIEVLRFEMTALESMKRIYTFLKRITREFVPQEIRG